MAIVHEVGKLVNQCEQYVIRYLADRLSNSWHVYHNLEFTPPQSGGHPYEYDAILVGPPGVWVVEVKGYSGHITGNASQLRLPNHRYERNPIPITNTKARVLKNNLIQYDPRLDDVYKTYVDARIVLCRETQLDIDDSQSNRILHVSDFLMFLGRQVANIHAENISQIISDFLGQRFAPLTKNNQIGEYIIEDSITHRGKHSVTYSARHALMRVRNRVSLKVFRFDTTQSVSNLESRKNLFVRNAEVLNLLDQFPHRNIARCFPPFLWESDKIVLPMEWIDGPTLQDWLREQKDWSFGQRLHIFKQICQGLEHAHNLGVIHRAISPKNVIILPDDTVKLVNFNFAKIDPALFTTTFGGETAAHHLVQQADWRYVAPELRDAARVVSPVADVFSAGVIFFELMTGRCPFKNGPIKQNTVLLKLKRYNTELSPGSDDLFQQMCQFNPADRIPSMTDVLKRISGLKQI